MGFFVPGAYFTGTKHDNGTYTCEVNPSGVAAGYTALTAMIFMDQWEKARSPVPAAIGLSIGVVCI